MDKAVAGAIDGGLKEDGFVREAASEDVRRTRGRVATLKNRLRALLSNQPGEVTEQARSWAVVVGANVTCDKMAQKVDWGCRQRLPTRVCPTASCRAMALLALDRKYKSH